MRRLTLLCCLLFLPCSTTLAASFDCAKASTPTEKSICASPVLGQLDQQVAKAYKALLKAQPGDAAQRVRDEQREWITTRDASGALEAVLRARLAALREALAVMSTPTDDAFDALLSMPTAKPSEGEWDIVAPDDFSADDEAGLIPYLAQQVKRGANVNEYRHYGTLLHHAIRAGLNKTSVWLLAHGADPAKRVEGEQRDARDALQLAVDYRRWSVLEALRKAPRYAGLTPSALAEAIWPAALSSPEAVNYLITHKLPLPEGAAGQCILEHALTELNFSLALALPERTPLRILPAQRDAYKGKMATLQYQCWNRDDDNTYWHNDFSHTKLATLPSAVLEAADARISVPILPYLLPAIVTPADALRLYRIKLRRPFEQPEFARRVLKAVLKLPYQPGVTRILLQPIPLATLRAALDNDAMMEMWFAQFRGESPADFAWALDVPTAAALNAHSSAVLKAMARQDYRAGAAALAQTWPLLLTRLRAPLNPAGVPELLNANLPPASWPALFKLGFRPTENELDIALAAATPDQLRQTWPTLAAVLPALPAHAVERMLTAFLPGRCNGSLTQADVDKVKFVLAQGARAPKRLELCAKAREGAEKPYAELLATGILSRATEVQPAPAAPVKLVADREMKCRIESNEAVRSVLAGGKIGGDERVNIEEVQAVDFPGDARCALVVSGSSMTNLDFDDEQAGSFDTGPTPEPHPSCPDPAIVKEVWRLRDGKIDVGAFEVPLYSEITDVARDSASGRRYFVVTEFHGKCGQDRDYLAAWVSEGGHEHLKALDPGTPAARAYEHQCAQATDAIDCFGESTSRAENAAEPAMTPHSPQDFIDAHLTAERSAFVKAVLAMDSARLQAELKAGVFGSWRVAAMAQVAASTLTPQEKRRRMAWLLDSPEHVIEIMRARRTGEKDISPYGLIITWLPQSAWDGLIEKISGRSSMLEPLRAAATEQGQHALACRLAKAFERSCRVGAGKPEAGQ